MAPKSYGIIFSAILTVLVLTAPLLGKTSAFATSTTKTGIMIPLYSYPGSSWNSVIQSKTANPSVPYVAIINPSNGPGNAIDSNFVSSIKKLQSANITVLGYVYTSY